VQLVEKIAGLVDIMGVKSLTTWDEAGNTVGRIRR
jgi:hypothetical protein